jgi:hypothetical protein
MPRGDRTGPGGMGSMTGRKAGFCSGSNSPGYTNSYGGGRGSFRGSGRGMRFGFRNFGQNITPPDFARPRNEAKVLELQASLLEEQLQGVRNRLEELEKSKK